MKFSLNWLNRYVDLDGVDVQELARRFTLSVAELEGVREALIQDTSGRILFPASDSSPSGSSA